MHPQSQERVFEAIEVMNWLATRSMALPEDKATTTQMSAIFAAANFYLIEYGRRVVCGAEPYDALIEAARCGSSQLAAHWEPAELVK
jgi:hypothetical protein